MRHRPALALVGLLALAACAGEAAPTIRSPFDSVSSNDPRELPANLAPGEGRPGTNGGIVFDPSSAPIDEGVAYVFSLGHCGLHSPVDLDGSFWDAVDGTTADGAALDLETDGEMINATPGVIVVIGDEARFRTESGSLVRFARHAGEKEFPGCM